MISTMMKRIGKGGTKVKGKRAAGIFFTDGNKVLLLKRAGEGDHIGTWALPGGKSKDGETDIGTAIREAKEETGLDAIPGFRFDSLVTKNGHQTFTGFLYRVPRPFAVHLSKEHSDSSWVPFEDLKEVELHPKLKESMPEYLHKIRKKITSFTEWVKLTECIVLLFD